MSEERLSLRERARRSFEQRQGSREARVSFLREANILDSQGNLDRRFFHESSYRDNHVVKTTPSNRG